MSRSKRPFTLAGSPTRALLGLWATGAIVLRVQQGTIAFGAGATATATIVAVNLRNAVVLFLGNDSDSNTDASLDTADVVLTNSTTVTATRVGTTNTGHPIVSYMVIEFMPGIVRSIQTFTMSVTAASQTATITAVNLSKTFLLPGGTTYNVADVLISKFFQYTTLTNTTTVTATRVTASGTLVVVGTVVEFW